MSLGGRRCKNGYHVLAEVHCCNVWGNDVSVSFCHKSRTLWCFTRALCLAVSVWLFVTFNSVFSVGFCNRYVQNYG